VAGTEDSFRTLIPSFVCGDAISFDVYRRTLEGVIFWVGISFRSNSVT